ncbi:hypothetical protein RI367_007098 [Sorochytrium milnesiophthora]
MIKQSWRVLDDDSDDSDGAAMTYKGGMPSVFLPLLNFIPSVTMDFDNPPRFSLSTYVEVVIVALLSTLLGLANAWLCRILLSRDVRRVRQTSALLMANLMASNASCFLFAAVLFVPKLVTRSYSLGFWGCQIEGFIVATTSDAMMWAAIWLAMDRFITIVLTRPLLSPTRFWTTVVVFGWVASAAVNSALVATLSGISLQSDGYLCEWDFTTRAPAAQRQLWITVALMAFKTVVVMVMYLWLYAKVRTTQRRAAADGLHSVPFIQSTVSGDQALRSQPTAVVAKIPNKAPVARQQPPAPPNNAEKSQQLERAVLIKVAIICSLAIVTAIIQEVRVYYAQMPDTSPAAMRALALMSSLNAALRCLVELYVVGTLDPAVRAAVRLSLQSVKDRFSRPRH